MANEWDNTPLLNPVPVRDPNIPGTADGKSPTVKLAILRDNENLEDRELQIKQLLNDIAGMPVSPQQAYLWNQAKELDPEAANNLLPKVPAAEEPATNAVSEE